MTRAQVRPLLLVGRVLLFAGLTSGPARAAPPTCENGVVVADPDANRGLVIDCANLLAAKTQTDRARRRSTGAARRPSAEWDGVTLAGEPPRVWRLHLQSRGLTGRIAPQLGRLTALRSLWLHDNRLGGPIPPELGSLRHLQFLSLSRNRLTGPIPPELGSLVNLQKWWLSDNQLTGPIPARLGNLRALRLLRLDHNQLTGLIPPLLGSLRNLESLWLNGNQLTWTIPAVLGNLAALRTLSLDGNQLRGRIPAALGSLRKLESLRLSHNRLTGAIPAALGELPALQYLDLRSNQLSGPIPAGLGSLPDLQRVYLSSNLGLTGCIPLGLWGPPDNDLRRLRLPDCPRPPPTPQTCESGTAVADPVANPGLVADCIALLATRDTLGGDATLNWGADTPIADWEGVRIWGDPPRVRSLDLRSRGLTGSLSPRLAGLSALRQLHLSGNQLTGPIPVQLASLHNLATLWLGKNQLTGAIPAEFGSLRTPDVPDPRREPPQRSDPARTGGPVGTGGHSGCRTTNSRAPFRRHSAPCLIWSNCC